METRAAVYVNYVASEHSNNMKQSLIKTTHKSGEQFLSEILKIRMIIVGNSPPAKPES